MDEEIFFTVAGFNSYHGIKPFKVNKIIKLIKDKDNAFDDEAISLEMHYAGKVGYISNSVKTVFRGTMSAGRIYDKIDDEAYGKIMFIGSNAVIARLLTKKEFKKEKDNPDSEIHFI